MGSCDAIASAIFLEDLKQRDIFVQHDGIMSIYNINDIWVTAKKNKPGKENFVYTLYTNQYCYFQCE